MKEIYSRVNVFAALTNSWGVEVGFTFISHCSIDKPLAKQLVRSLAVQGLQLWVDRPGFGDVGESLSLPQEFIDSYRVEGIRIGNNWMDELNSALHRAGVVVGCLSRNLKNDRTVLAQELAIALRDQKLITCIIDDLPAQDIQTLGLAQLDRLQAIRIDCVKLGHAVDRWLRNEPQEVWPIEEIIPWNGSQLLKKQIDQRLMERGVWSPTDAAVQTAKHRIEIVPIGPPMDPSDMPNNIGREFAQFYSTKQTAWGHINNSMRIIQELNREKFELNQIILRPPEIVDFTTASAEDFWMDVLILANHKSRRTLAGLLATPGPSHTLETFLNAEGEIGNFVRQVFERPGWEAWPAV